MNRNKPLVVCIICLLMLVSIPMASSDDTSTQTSGGMADNVIMRCWGPGVYNIKTQNYLFMYEYFHFMNVSIHPKYYVAVSKLDGTVLLDYSFIEPLPIPPDYSVGFWIFFFDDFWETGHTFGFFKITVDFDVLDDGSSTQWTFYGFAFQPFVKIFYLGQYRYLYLPWLNNTISL